MSLAKKWKESPLVSLVVTLIAIGSTTFGFVQYFAALREHRLNEKHALEVESLKAEIASFKLSLTDQEAFDLKSLVLKIGDSNSVPASSQFFADDSFYAVRSTDHWNYQMSSESDYYKQANIELGMGEAVEQAAKQALVHVWKADDPIMIGVGDGEIIRLQPSILVQRMDDRKLAMALGINPNELATNRQFDRQDFVSTSAAPVGETYNDVAQYRSDKNPAAKNPMESVFHALREDRTGKYFQLFSFQQFQASLISESLHYSLNRVQKSGDMLYAQSSTRFDDAMVDGRRRDRYYLHQEDFFIADQNQVYLIRMTVPSSEPVVGQNQRAEMTRWIQQFRIVRD